LIKQGDIFDIPILVEECSVDVVIYDPPYGINKKKLLQNKINNWKRTNEEWDFFESVEKQYEFYSKTLHLLFSLIKKTGSIFIFGSYHNIFLIGSILQLDLKAKIINTIVWNKTNAMFNVTKSGLI